MRTKSDTQVLEEYDDLADGSSATVRVLRALDAGYSSAPLPPSLRQLKLPVRREGTVKRLSKRRQRWALSGPVAALAVVAVVVAGSLAAGKPPNILNLGKPTNDVSSTGWASLDNFHRIPITLRSGEKPEVLFVGGFGYADGTTDGERWSVVKALEQFGSLSHVRALQKACGQDVGGHSICSGYPTFDLSHAKYRSRYVAFADREIAITPTNPKGKYIKYQKLSGEARALYKRYARLKLSGPFAYLGKGLPGKLPMVVAGNYLETSSSLITASTFLTPLKGAPTYCPSAGCTPEGESYVVSFDTARQSLVRDKNPDNSSLVQDINGEANVITALICHADGKKPASVCGRPVIKKLLKLAK